MYFYNLFTKTKIRLLFSDKTGTLTKNEMLFQQFSVNGIMYSHQGLSIQETQSGRLRRIHEFNVRDFNLYKFLFCN